MKKKTIFAIFIGAALMMATVSFNACTKQDEVGQNTETAKLSNENEQFIKKLVKFKEKIDNIKANPQLKSGETMDADEAIWGMETLFNASYGFAGENYRKTKTDEDIITIGVDENGDVLVDDVVAKYGEITDLVRQSYYNSGFDNKGLILMNLKKGDIVEGQMEITVNSVTGKNEDPPPPTYDPFGENDYWYYGKLKGDCDWNNGFGETDAAEKIQEYVMGNRFFHQPEPLGPPGYHLVYEVDPDYPDGIPLIGDEYADENGDKLIFFIQNNTGVFADEEKCLEPDEMNFHFHGEETVIYDIIPDEYNKPGWILICCEIEGEEYSDSPNYIFQIRHRNKLTYGTRYFVPNGVIDPPTEL